MLQKVIKEDKAGDWSLSQHILPNLVIIFHYITSHTMELT